MLPALDSLVVPAAFARHDKITDATILADLYAWRSNTEFVLNQLDLSNIPAFSVSELARLVGVLAPLTAVAQWSSPAVRSLALACLARIPASDQLVADILTHVVKPLFAPTPHPRLHTSTGRILPRPADVQDTYIEQPWKEHPGLDDAVRWCLLNTQSSAYENMWPLFLPPVMTFLDDYQVPYKLLGVRLVSDMLTRAPSGLLLRTGVDELMFVSLTNSLSHLGDRSTPDFIHLAVTTTLQLIDLTTPSAFPPYFISPHDSQSRDIPATVLTHSLSTSQSKSLSTRFSRLSTLLSSSLLGTVIMYTPTFLLPELSSGSGPDPFADLEHTDTSPAHEPYLPPSTPKKQSFNPTLIAAAQALPPVLLAFGIGGARFLKGIVPLLAEWLSLPLPIVAIETGSVLKNNEGASLCNTESSPDHSSKLFVVDATLHLASLSCLTVLFRTCTPRMEGWSMTILNALGRCWIECVDIENEKRNNNALKDSLCALKKQLKEATVQLANVNPNITKEYGILLAYDKSLFDGLVEEIPLGLQAEEETLVNN